MIELHQLFWRGKPPSSTCCALFASMVATSIGVFFIWTGTGLALRAASVGPTQGTQMIDDLSILEVESPVYLLVLYAGRYLRGGIARQLSRRFLHLLLPPAPASALGVLLVAVAAGVVR